jgi:hypothetical protein
MEYVSGEIKVSCPATRHGGTWGERRYSSYSYLTSALDGGEWSASRPGRALTPGKGPLIPWVGPRFGLDAEARRKILCLCRGSNPDRPARGQTLSCLSYRGLSGEVHLRKTRPYKFNRYKTDVHVRDALSMLSMLFEADCGLSGL